MSKEPLDPEKPDQNGKDAGETRVLAIDNLHLHANDIDSLRRLSEQDPDLARIIVDQRDTISRREHSSYRFGVVAAVLFVLGVLVALSYILVKVGIVLSIVLLIVILAIALLVRVILTGEWSDTSIIGKLTTALITALGGKPKDQD